MVNDSKKITTLLNSIGLWMWNLQPNRLPNRGGQTDGFGRWRTENPNPSQTTVAIVRSKFVRNTKRFMRVTVFRLRRFYGRIFTVYWDWKKYHIFKERGNKGIQRREEWIMKTKFLLLKAVNVKKSHNYHQTNISDEKMLQILTSCDKLQAAKMLKQIVEWGGGWSLFLALCARF